MGTQPIAAARAKGNQAATDAISHFFASTFRFIWQADCRAADWMAVIVAVFCSGDQF